MNAFLTRFKEILSQLDACADGEALEETCAELEDAIFLLECAEDAEEIGGAIEELEGLSADILRLADGRETLLNLARELAAAAELAKLNL